MLFAQNAQIVPERLFLLFAGESKVIALTASQPRAIFGGQRGLIRVSIKLLQAAFDLGRQWVRPELHCVNVSSEVLVDFAECALGHMEPFVIKRPLDLL